MEILIGSKVKHLKNGKICEILKINEKTYRIKRLREGYDFIYEEANIKKDEVEIYIEPVKEKSAYDKMRERNLEDAKALSPSPKEVDQHIFWLKMAVVDRIEKIENRIDHEVYTFRYGNTTDEKSKFGFSEHYVNLLMHYAYEAGHKRATENLTRDFNESTKRMKAAIDSIVSTLDDNGFLPYEDNCY